jgi:hypothetical protein
MVKDLDTVPREDREQLTKLVVTATKATSYVPLALLIRNSSTIGIRNLYVELEVSATSDHTEICDQPWIIRRPAWTVDRMWVSGWSDQSEVSQLIKLNLAEFAEDRFQKTDKGWRLTFEWEALQPQRIRLITPVLCTYNPESTTISYKAKVFADSFPEPLDLKADVNIDVTQKLLGLEEL